MSLQLQPTTISNEQIEDRRKDKHERKMNEITLKLPCGNSKWALTSLKKRMKQTPQYIKHLSAKREKP